MSVIFSVPNMVYCEPKKALPVPTRRLAKRGKATKSEGTHAMEPNTALHKAHSDQIHPPKHEVA